MNLTDQYKGWMPPVTITSASAHEKAVDQRKSLFVEIKLLDPQSKENELIPLSDWILERAVVIEPEKPSTAHRHKKGEDEGDGGKGDCYRLSGGLMRNHFYFATAPGNEFLYIATKKHNLYRELPSVG